MKQKTVAHRKPMDEEKGIEVLKIVVDIFNNRGVKYFLEYGSLLGALKLHKFIPWDDDIDIGIQHHDQSMYYTLINDFKEAGFTATDFREGKIMNIDFKDDSYPHIDIHFYRLPQGSNVLSAVFYIMPSFIRKSIIKIAQMSYFRSNLLRPKKAELRDNLKRCRAVQLMTPVFFCYGNRSISFYDTMVSIPYYGEDLVTLYYGKPYDDIKIQKEFVCYTC